MSARGLLIMAVAVGVWSFGWAAPPRAHGLEPTVTSPEPEQSSPSDRGGETQLEEADDDCDDLIVAWHRVPITACQGRDVPGCPTPAWTELDSVAAHAARGPPDARA